MNPADTAPSTKPPKPTCAFCGFERTGGNVLSAAPKLLAALKAMVEEFDGPAMTAEHAQVVARGRQVLLLTAIMPKIDQLLIEAAQARVPAPGLLEIREWCEFSLEENATAAAASMKGRAAA